MKRILAFVFSVLIPLSALAEEASTDASATMIRPAGDIDLSEFLWINRPVVVFANSPADPQFSEQMDLLTDEIEALRERDVVIITDTDPAAKSAVRQKLRPRGFMLVLIGKDGGVKLRKPLPWNVRELTRSIDKMPIRQREIRERREDG
jgi:hypothetical protein